MAAEAAGWWFLFQGTQLLVADGPLVTVPRGAGPAAFGLAPQSMQQLGTLDGVPCFVGALATPPEVPPPGCCLVGLRELFGYSACRQALRHDRCGAIIWVSTLRIHG